MLHLFLFLHIFFCFRLDGFPRAVPSGLDSLDTASALGREGTWGGAALGDRDPPAESLE